MAASRDTTRIRRIVIRGVWGLLALSLVPLASSLPNPLPTTSSSESYYSTIDKRNTSVTLDKNSAAAGNSSSASRSELDFTRRGVSCPGAFTRHDDTSGKVLQTFLSSPYVHATMNKDDGQLARRDFAHLDDTNLVFDPRDPFFDLLTYSSEYTNNPSNLNKVVSITLSYNNFRILFFRDKVYPPNVQRIIIYDYEGSPSDLEQMHHRLATETSAASIRVYDSSGLSFVAHTMRALRDAGDEVVAKLHEFFRAVRNTASINDPILFRPRTGGRTSKLVFSEAAHKTTPLLYSIRMGHTRTANAIISARNSLGLDLAGSSHERPLDPETESPLHMALRRNIYSVAGNLVSHGMPPTQFVNGRSCPAVCNLRPPPELTTESQRAIKSLFDTLVVHGDRIDEPCVFGAEDDGQQYFPNALYKAAAVGDDYIIELLIDAGLHVDGPEHIKYTPLSLALERNLVNTARLLISRGADTSRAVSRPPATDMSDMLARFGRARLNTDTKTSTLIGRDAKAGASGSAALLYVGAAAVEGEDNSEVEEDGTQE